MSLEDRVREAVEHALARLRVEFDGHQQNLISAVNGIAEEERTAWRSHLEGAVDEARRDADREAEARVDAAREQVRKEAEDQIAAEREKARQTAQDEIAAAREQAEREAAQKIEAARDEARRDASEQANAAREQAHRDAAEQINAAREQAQREAAEQITAAREQAQRDAAEQIAMARDQARREAAEQSNAAREQAQRDAAAQIAAANVKAERAEQAERDAQAKVDALRHQAPAAAPASASAAGTEVVARVLGSVHRIGGAESLRAVLEALGNGAKSEASRVALMLIDHDRLSPWVAFGFDHAQEPGEASVSSIPAFGSAIADRRVVALPPSEGSTAPPFLRAAAGREVRIFPLVVGGNVVAAVCAEGATGRPGEAAPAWSQAIELLVQHASLRLENLTSLRTVEALTTSS